MKVSHSRRVMVSMRASADFSSAGAVLLISDPVAHFTFKHVEDFILVMVDMQRRRVPL